MNITTEYPSGGALKWKKGGVKSSEGRKRTKVESGNFVLVSHSEKRPEKNTGRPNCLSGERLKQLLSVYYSRPYSLRRLGDMFGVSRMTVWRAVQGAAFQTV
jgi:hypothetical protein